MSDFSDFAALFSFTLSPLEIFVRGTAVYWFLFALFRFAMRRDVGSIAIADVLLLVLIADAAQNAMAGGYESIADGCLLVATLAGWNYLLDWSSYRFPAVRRLVEARPLLLVKDGRPLRANMRRELITFEELEAKLRQAGVDQLAEVHEAYMESDGEITLLLADESEAKKPADKNAKASAKTGAGEAGPAGKTGAKRPRRPTQSRPLP